MRPGDIVGLWLARGIELLVLQAAIAKAAPPGCQSTRTRPWSACRCAWTTRRPPA
ncbi:hypothetical protein LP420_41570 [Massilia sp. B-10]|nr:hypothetical protein LP420_41570 [Massilia sp. B-10]